MSPQDEKRYKVARQVFDTAVIKQLAIVDLSVRYAIQYLDFKGNPQVHVESVTMATSLISDPIDAYLNVQRKLYERAVDHLMATPDEIFKDMLTNKDDSWDTFGTIR